MASVVRDPSDGTPGNPRGRATVAAIRGEKISRGLARLIARDIAERRLPPGAKLAPEHVMAEEFGVGRTSVREALRLLEAQGIVEIRPGLRGGPVVGTPTGDDLGRTMTLFFQMQGALVGDVLDARVSFEGLVAANAAMRAPSAPKEQLDALAAAGRADHKGLSDQDWIRSGLHFHALVKGLISNPVLLLIDDAVGAVVADRIRSDQHVSWTDDERRRVAEEHAALTDAIVAGDADTARAIAEAHQRGSNESVHRFYPGLAGELIDWH